MEYNILVKIFDRGKYLSRQIQFTELIISNGVTNRDGLDSLTVKELIDGVMS